jgi:predicted TPR repeat methyltransferase
MADTGNDKDRQAREGRTPPPDEPTGTTSPTLTLPDAVELGVRLHKAGMLDAAEEIYQRVLAAAPEHADVIHFYGLSRYQRGEHDQGLALVQRALALAPDHVDARNNLGNMLLEQDHIDEAEAAYRQVLALRPEHAHAHTNLGVVLTRRQDLAGAEAEFRQALVCDAEHGEAYHNLGALLQNSDRGKEALAAYQKALTLRPYDGESYRRVGATLYALGRVDEATVLYERWVALEPESATARHMLAACTGRDVPARASDAFVKQTFDSFANSFDFVLERLKYRAPALITNAVAAAIGQPAAALDVLDAGAGTGWCGPLLRPYARRLVGVDLSAGMLAKAAKRACYDELETGELVAYMRAHPAAFDLVISADTLVYFGDLGEAMLASAASLRPGGHLIFTVERTAEDPGPGYRLHPHGRYSHHEDYLRRVLLAAGLAPLALRMVHLRAENGVPVEGWLVISSRDAPPASAA